MSKFYIMDIRQVVGNCVLWWCPEGKGYTTQLEEAGLYDEGASSRETDVFVPEEVARQCSVTHVRVERLREELDKRGIKWPVRKAGRR